MKTSLGVDCIGIILDYEAVKEVVQTYRDCRSKYERTRLRTSERDENFALRVGDLLFATEIQNSAEKLQLSHVRRRSIWRFSHT
jgi:hypothetical protein